MKIKKKSIIFQVIINTIRLERKLGFFSYKLISIYKLLVLFLWKLHPIPFFLTTFQKELYIIKALLGCVKLQIVSMKISKTNPDHFITLHDMANLGTMFSWSFLQAVLYHCCFFSHGLSQDRLHRLYHTTTKDTGEIERFMCTCTSNLKISKSEKHISSTSTILTILL